MKKRLLLLSLLTATFFTQAQNVGVGTTTPQATLDVKGNLRTGGINNYILYDSLAGKITWTNSNLWVTTPQYLMRHSPTLEGLYSNGSQLEYRNSTGNPIFFTNWSNGNGYFSGLLKIDGGLASGSPFNPGPGTISASGAMYAPILYDNNNTSYYLDPASTSNLNAFRFNVADCINGYCPPNNAIRMTPNFHFNSAAGYAVIVNWDNGTTGNTQTFRVGNGAGADVFYVTANGNVVANGNIGIGMSNPQQKLSVLYGMNIDQADLNNGTLDNNVLRFGSNSGEGVGSGRAGGSNNQYGLDFYTNSSKKMSITNTGNVGIGISNPNAPLGFAPALGKKITLYPGATGDVGMAVQGNLLQIYSDNPNADIAFGYDQGGTMTERMRIKANGNVGIGTTTPAATLEVNGYTKLGSDAPSVKFKKLTGTTAATEGGFVTIAHGLNSTKIISVSVMVFNGANEWIEPNIQGASQQFYWYMPGGSIFVTNRSGDSALILSKSIKILITYEE